MTVGVELLLTGARLAGTAPGVEGSAVGVVDGTIAHVGEPGEMQGEHVVDVGGRLLTPGLIDCHTHSVFGGSRVAEFEARLAGSTYEEIALAGGGILSTVAATRAASEEELFAGALGRLRWLSRSGVTTVEVKSGYGLDLETELAMLGVARRLGRESGLHVHTTLLAAHTVPPEYRDDPDAYVEQVCEVILPAAVDEGLVDSVDVFCERIAFSHDQADRVLSAGAARGLPVRLHADQLSDMGGAALAASHRALSADHLEHAAADGLAAMAEAGTVAVLVPGASTFLGEATRPPVAEMRRVGVELAIATDLNPGTSPVASLPLAMALACTRFGLSVDEAFRAVTSGPARALGLDDRGRIAPGARADLVVWHATEVAELAYWMGAPLAALTIAGGTILWSDGSLV